MDKPQAGWRRLVVGATEEPAAARPEGEPRPAEPVVAVIASGVEMNGRLVVPQSLRVEGEFRGELEIGASVFVSDSGSIEAPIRARTVEIHGAVVGDVVASREVVIFASGRLHGDVESPSVVVERGATFNGRVRMYRPERSVQAAESAVVHSSASLPESQP